ncbi:hypothetical protein [Sphingomonas sp.]|uniref:hypothetical protein n=1 Tax=Sphingomonas sp. TaxID=28214 RepID=UPI003D6D69F2
MIPIVREFFRGLKERHELDAIIPELLTAMGFEVISRPMIGTRQYGADVAAIGVDEDGVRKLFLFVIKKGDLTREEWDDSSQAVRPSLNEVRDAYLSGVAPEHKALPVVVCITVGGIVRENILMSVNGYMAIESKSGIEFRLWTGDTLTGKIVDGALREEVFPPELRTLLRRAAALVEEPEAAFAQFARLVEHVASNGALDPVSRVRILYLALWILTVWGREAKNLEAPYRASEFVILRAWILLRPKIESDRSRKLAASHTFLEVVQLHLLIWDDLYGEKILPYASSLHALSFAAWSHEALDVNLALFETVGRVAMGGLWRAWLEAGAGSLPDLIEQPGEKLAATAVALAQLIEANPALYTPACDDHAIDINLALMLLTIVPQTRGAAAHWVSQAANATMICYRRGSSFPVIETDYATLIRYPSVPEEELRKEMTAGSILYPMLAAFAWGFGDDALVGALGEFQTGHLAHSNFQIWVPNARSEERIWLGERNGSVLGGLSIGNDGSALIAALRREIDQNTAYPDLSAVKLDHWPMLLLACRCYRMPPPPQLWLPLLDALAAASKPKTGRWVKGRPRSIGGVARVRQIALRSAGMGALMHGQLTMETMISD